MYDEEFIDGIKRVNLYSEEVALEMEREAIFRYNPELREYDRLGALDESPAVLRPQQLRYNQNTRKTENLPSGSPGREVKKQTRLQKLWENNGPIKLLPTNGLYSLFFYNFQNWNYRKLDEYCKQFGNWKLMRELEDGRVRVRYEKEEEIRKCYNSLKTDSRFEVSALLDIDEFHFQKKKRKPFGNYGHMPEGLNEGELDEQTKRYLEMEKNIKFTIPQVKRKESPPPVEDTPEDESDDDDNHGKFLGYYQGNPLYLPKKPYVNKYAKPPPSYHKWQNSRHSNFSKHYD